MLGGKSYGETNGDYTWCSKSTVSEDECTCEEAGGTESTSAGISVPSRGTYAGHYLASEENFPVDCEDPGEHHRSVAAVGGCDVRHRGVLCCYVFLGDNPNLSILDK